MKQYNLKPISYKLKASPGQTLIETLVGVSILTTGLIAGLSLAIHSFSASTVATRSDVASGLAGEGIEVVRRLRDSNWLAGTLTDCGGQFCYNTWLSGSYNITGATGAGTEYRMIFNPAAVGNKWTLSPSGPGSNYRLYVQGTGAYTHTVNARPSPFFRKIEVIYTDTAAPYDATSPLVLVRSTVWWTDKLCGVVADPALTTCKIASEAFLTNWKNY